MKKVLTNILILSLLLLVVSGVFVPHTVHAQSLISSFISIPFDGFLSIVSFLGDFFLTISARILAISGMLLNSAMDITLHISDIVNAPGIGNTIDSIWRTIRDFSSIFFIFLLLYGSISTILGIEGNLAPKKLIPRIILVGLLINFSLFFTRIVIDVSNVVSLGFYSAITPNDQVTNIGVGPLDIYASDGGISNVFMQTLGIATIYDPQGVAKTKENFKYQTIAVKFLGATVILVAAASFFAISMMLIVRIVILLLLMAFSPLYFIGLILPKTQELSSKWMSNLMSQALFPPVYLALIYVALKIMEGTNFLFKPGTGSFSDVFTGGTSIGVVFKFLIAIVLINYALIVAAKTMGASGKFTQKWTKTFKGVVASQVGRRTVGWAAHGVKESNTFRNIASSVPTLGITAYKGLDTLENKKFGGDKVSYASSLKDTAKKKKDFYKYVGEGENKAEAKDRQANYFASLNERHLISLMLKKRADEKAYSDIKKERDKKEAKENKGKNTSASAKIQKEIDSIDDILNNDLKLVAQNKSREELEKQKEELKAKKTDIDKKVNLADEAEEDEIVNKLKGKMKDDDKKEEKGEKKEEKKDEGDKDDH